ncbi:hypothetical protein [Massilia cavernae]|uniref:DUF4760 domain-containing protein n=1 Tax=Massilia cavernae TaxID=2320864 RepID=A0A418XFY4_9BURK|nr:hypothetical protein [Massilia cavernae]RJG11372.1 hypothetical protein D3872_19785 [Massilia cavernae]
MATTKRLGYVGLGAAVVVALLLPIAALIWQFGFEISGKPEDWAQTATVLSGAYGPLLSLLTLGVLFMQVRLQRQTSDHVFEQAFVQTARTDIEFFLVKIDAALDAPTEGGGTARERLLAAFARRTLDELKSEALRQEALRLHASNPQLYSTWTSIYTILISLSWYKNTTYGFHFYTPVQKIVAIVPMKVGAALDNYIWCHSQGELRTEYQFSTILMN